jgi:organic radical activating enzyme
MIDPTDPVACSLVYHGLVVDTDGGIDPCCQYNNLLTNYEPEKIIKFYEFDQYQTQVQGAIDRDIKAGIKHDKCSKCWSEESAGLTTIRQYWNQAFGAVANPTIAHDNPLYHVEFRLGNFCNLKCFMCHPIASSSIAAEQRANKQQFMDLGIYNEVELDPYWETDEFSQFIDSSLQHVKFLHITGGEPFIIPQVLNILDRVLPNANNINLSFNTNLTRVSDALLDRLAQFKNLNLYVSLEGTGLMNDYVRYPSKWADILKNIERMRNQAPNATLNVQHVFQHTSVYAFPELAKFQTQNQFRLFPTLIQGRDFLTFDSVPPADLDRFRIWLNNTDLVTEEHRTFMTNTINAANFDLALYRRYRQYVSVLDGIRGNNYDEIFKPAEVQQ